MKATHISRMSCPLLFYRDLSPPMPGVTLLPLAHARLHWVCVYWKLLLKLRERLITRPIHTS